MIRGFKIRLYPTKEQEEKFWKHIHGCRFIYNYMLDLNVKLYKDGINYIGIVGMSKELTRLRNSEEFRWLGDLSRKSMEMIIRDLDFAFHKFFKKQANFPKFKSKKICVKKFPISYSRFYFKSCDYVNIERCGKVKCKKTTRFLFGRGVCKFINPRVSYINGKWILSFAMECDNQAPQKLNGSMGIDLGIKELATVSYNGEITVFHNINKSKKMKKLESRKRYYQHRMDKVFVKNGRVHSCNWEKLRKKFNQLCVKQSNIRDNYIHQITRQLVNLFPQKVVMENLVVTDMVKNKYLSYYILEQKFYMFIDVMRYKCEWAGIEFILADRFYPSSKTCSCCGNIKKDLKLSDRVYKCEKCGLIIDRDENAAKNLEKYIA